MEDEQHGIDIDFAHPKAIELIPEEFFWSCFDEISPFGSDEGDTALAEYRDWRKQNPNIPTVECLKWVIESVGEMEFSDYNRLLATKENVQALLEDHDFDDQQYIYTLDNSVIATGFAQLADEGIIEAQNKSTIQVAIDRQIIWAQLATGWEHAAQYIDNLKILDRALKAA